MKFWQSISFSEIDQYVEIAKIAEEVGFEGAFLSDHGSLGQVPTPDRQGAGPAAPCGNCDHAVVLFSVADRTSIRSSRRGWPRT